MNADDRTLLLDLENIGTVRLRPHLLRARLETLLAAAGEIHHAIAAYAAPPDGAQADPLASLLAELRIAPLRVPPAANAAELALLAHAHYVHAEGGRIFLIASADRRFAELATLGRVELLIWDGQPVAARLAEVAHRLHRITRPTGKPAENVVTQARPGPDEEDPAPPPSSPAAPQRHGHPLADRLLAAVATGVGIAVAQRLIDTLLRRRKH